jgi:hypothetical protein
MSGKSKIYIIISLFFFSLMLYNNSSANDNAHDFINEARLVHTVLASGGGQIPSGMDAVVIDAHNLEVRRNIERVRVQFVNIATPFISALLPAELPKSVVYPFGGGDLLTAIVTYPQAVDFTTISLESAGDPQRLFKASVIELRDSMTEFRKMAVHLLVNHDSGNANLRNFERGIIPGQLAFSLIAASVYGYEPVSLKYFRIEPDGRLYYYSKKDIEELANVKGKKLARFWVDTDFSIAFRNMELTLRKKDSGSGPQTIVHRHIAANLDNSGFSESPLKKFLEKKGKISAMTKAGSYLLWMDDFSAFREYFLKNMAFMVADSTGILPRHASEAGFEQITYGKFFGAFLENDGGENAAEMRKLWNSQPYRQLPFRYGYSDIKASNHLMIMKPKNTGNK